MVITSKDNKTIKDIKKLKESKYRKEKYIVEGLKMLEEAFNENVKIEAIVVKQDDQKNIDKINELINKFSSNKNVLKKSKDGNNLNIIKKNDTKIENNYSNIKIIEVTDSIFMQLTDVKTPQGVLAVIFKNSKGSKDIENVDNDTSDNCIKENSEYRIDANSDFILALDGIQDPGNLGTIIRTADSANLKQILVSKDTVDAYSPKVIRSTMGSIYRVKIIECENLKNTLQELKKQNFKIVSTSLNTENSIYDINYSKKVVVIGNEGSGVSKEIQEISDYKVKIPMLGKTESLNASVATGIMIYEYVRQKNY